MIFQSRTQQRVHAFISKSAARLSAGQIALLERPPPLSGAIDSIAKQSRRRHPKAVVAVGPARRRLMDLPSSPAFLSRHTIRIKSLDAIRTRGSLAGLPEPPRLPTGQTNKRSLFQRDAGIKHDRALMRPVRPGPTHFRIRFWSFAVGAIAPRSRCRPRRSQTPPTVSENGASTPCWQWPAIKTGGLLLNLDQQTPLGSPAAAASAELRSPSGATCNSVILDDQTASWDDRIELHLDRTG